MPPPAQEDSAPDRLRSAMMTLHPRRSSSRLQLRPVIPQPMTIKFALKSNMFSLSPVRIQLKLYSHPLPNVAIW